MPAPRAAIRILAVGGTDPLCGAGMVLDAAAIADAGCAPLAVVSALVTQDSHGVSDLEPTALDGFARRLARALADGEPHAIKTGALATADHADQLARALDAHGATPPLVVDPVLRSGDGAGALARPGLVNALASLAARPGVVVTPNVPELAALLDADPADIGASADALRDAAVALASARGCAVLAKGGHLSADIGTDWLVDGDTCVRLDPIAAPGGDLHGTGCWLASALAAQLGRGVDLVHAADAARRSLRRARRRALRVGSGRAQLVVGGTR